jgi:hypothetical protein
MDTVLRQDLIDVALRATDAYLGVEKHAMEKGYATQQDIHDFSFYLSKAHDALEQLGDIDNHADYMQNHVNTMMKLSNHDDTTLSDLPFTHVPKSKIGFEESVRLQESDGPIVWKSKTHSIEKVGPNQFRVYMGDKKLKLYPSLDAAKSSLMTEEVEQIDEEASKGLAGKAAKSGVSLSTLKKVYSRGVAAWRTGHRPGTTPQQWGMARVNSYITKGKTYHTADKDLREESKKKLEHDIDEKDVDEIVKGMDWEDIVDLYDKEELTEETQLDEKLSPAARLKKQRDFTRTGTKRNILLQMKLKRPSSPSQIQQRAVVAARRALSKRFLQGRNKDQLSPQEKDILEARLKRLREMGIQQMVAQKMIPRIRQIEQKRLKSKR